MLRGKRGLLLTSLGLAIFLVYLAYSNPFPVLAEVGRFDPVIFALAVVVNWLGLFFFASSWYVLLSALGVGVTVWEAVKAMFVSLFVVWMVPIPSGTEIIRAYLVREEEGSDLGKAVSSVVVHKAYYNLAFGFMIALGVVMVTFFGGASIPVRPELVWFVILFAVVSSALYGMILTPALLKSVYFRSPAWVRRNVFDRVYDPGRGGFMEVVDEVDESIRALAGRPVHNAASILMVAFHWSTGALTAYMVSLSMGWPLDFWVGVLVYAVIEFIQQLNILIPGGLGVIDASLTGALVVLGMPLSAASAVSLLTRLATYWFELLLCGAVTFAYGYRETLRGYVE